MSIGSKSNDYIFTFLGEFGYEMFNWQGVIRKWVQLHKQPNDRVIICGRKGLQSVYEYADEYYEISNIESYRKSTAGIYIAVLESEFGYDQEGCSELNRKCVDDIKRDVQGMVMSRTMLDNPKWIWSSDPQYLKDCAFGKIGPQQGGIYSQKRTPWSYLDLNNNRYAPIEIQQSDSHKKNIEKELGFDLDEDYILCQSAKRDSFMSTKSKETIDHEKVISELSKHRRVVYLNFDTGRAGDSKSTEQLIKMKWNPLDYINDDELDSITDQAEKPGQQLTTLPSDGMHQYKCDGFDEQGCLIKHANDCVFFVEGDFRSHLYVPPFLGRDVRIVAHSEIYDLYSAPINFWNKNVFQFGGQMIPYSYEDLNVDALVGDLS
jgi:hypothetical protein|tara:strand:+ start:3013 stop:4140 length:1128 start_codon:yes stop_codon:yes gene_type:complete